MNIDPNPEPNAEVAAAASAATIVPSSTDHLAVAAAEAGFTAATTALVSGEATAMKCLSPEKIAANRRNAQRSTGPKTARGKAASRLNALKHRALAQSVLVRGRMMNESPQEFKELCQEYYTNLAPVGPLEQMLVDQIVQAAWRLRRARTAESGEITLSVDGGWARRMRSNPLLPLLAMPQGAFGEGLVERLKQSVLGCEYLRACLEKLGECVAADGELTEAGLDSFKKRLRDTPDAMIEKLGQFRAWLLANPEALDPETLRARHRTEVLQFLETAIDEVKCESANRAREEEVEERARQSAAVLPKGEAIDRVLRYEKALENQLFRAMNQLERWQRRREGGEVPAPLTMELSA